ncbi:MAG TPA: hypothetical protein VNX47_05830 [Nevskia sp.]|jgi:hypothetical protein|nr:hypothetical protein [Nevskia sp.]
MKALTIFMFFGCTLTALLIPLHRGDTDTSRICAAIFLAAAAIIMGLAP